jgi:DNA-binding MarR family transcriptional regulator
METLYGQAVDQDADLELIQEAVSELLRLTLSARVHETRLRATGLNISRTNFRILSRMDDLGPVSVSRVANVMDLSQPTASRSLRQLEEDGLVERRSDAADGRMAIYEVTSRGRRVRRKLQEFMHGQLTDALADMPVGRRHDLAVLLKDLVARLQDPQASLSSRGT